jgi:hypothetical protein
MVCKEAEIAALQNVPEVPDGGESGQEFAVECRVFRLRRGQFSAEKSQR